MQLFSKDAFAFREQFQKFEEGTEHLSLRPFCGGLRGSLLLQHQNDRIS